MKYTLTFAFMASFAASSAFAAFKAPLPEFKNEKQLAEMRAAQSSKATSQGYKSEETAFYTGKPYLSATESYAFKYRSYDPELARWTSEDPSGFPDGANGSIYSTNPMSGCDPNGLQWTKGDFLLHFYKGGGRTVTLKEIGFLDDITNFSNLNPAGGAYRFGKQIEQTASALGKPYTGSFRDSFERSYDFTDVAFCIGSATLSATYDGWITSTPYISMPGGTYSYEEWYADYGNKTRIHFMDNFTDPLSISENIYGSSTGGPAWLQALSNVGGTAFKIVGSWQQNYIGFGNYE